MRGRAGTRLALVVVAASSLGCAELLDLREGAAGSVGGSGGAGGEGGASVLPSVPESIADGYTGVVAVTVDASRVHWLDTEDDVVWAGQPDDGGWTVSEVTQPETFSSPNDEDYTDYGDMFAATASHVAVEETYTMDCTHRRLQCVAKGDGSRASCARDACSIRSFFLISAGNQFAYVDNDPNAPATDPEVGTWSIIQRTPEGSGQRLFTRDEEIGLIAASVDHIYFFSPPSEIHRTPRNNDKTSEVVASSIAPPIAMVVSTDALYWLEGGNGQLHRQALLENGELSAGIETLSVPARATELTTVGTAAVFVLVSGPDGAILRFDDGLAQESVSLADGLDDPHGMGGGAGALVWANAAGSIRRLGLE